MTEIPTWVVIAAGIFFVVNILFFVVLIGGALYMLSMLKEFMPRIVSLEQNVETLVVRLQDVAEKLEHLTVSVQDMVENVGGKAKGIAGSAEVIAESASRQFERFSPYVMGAMTAYRVLRALNEGRKARGRHDRAVELKAVRKHEAKQHPLRSLLGL